jgi:ABC-type oligopeptide transport system ATPase subunit
MPPNDDVLLRADDLACWFDVSPPWLERTLSRQPEQTLKAVDGVSLSVPRGTTLSIVGESGCGKSTLAKLLVGLVAPTRGTLRYGRNRKGGVLHPQMIFQDPYASLNPRWRVGNIVAEPITTLGLRATPAETRRRVDELLELVGLSASDAGRFPHEFSGGQRQRISIARALATEAEFLVCDEPTSALDVSVQAQILNLMGDLQKEFGLTYVFISHNLSVVRHVSDSVAVMYLGRRLRISCSTRHSIRIRGCCWIRFRTWMIRGGIGSRWGVRCLIPSCRRRGVRFILGVRWRGSSARWRRRWLSGWAGGSYGVMP